MKLFNQIFAVLFCVCSVSMFSQQITMNACNTLLDSNDYIFEQVNTVNGRNSFETVADPMMGSRDCSGIGFCKLKIEWSSANTRWEILADDGNDNFTNTYLLYYNDEASMPNPPGLTLGTWEEATTVTLSQCGVINSLSGSVLGIDDNTIETQFRVYPNPVKDKLYLSGSALEQEYTVSLFDVLGKRVVTQKDVNYIDVSQLRRGVYFLKIRIDDTTLKKKIIIQ
ncbi:T9SS type A sorting domain-containing protein [uncultured Winogradskyella sp.]|uniref:T9SS type A sorting domain-containing protein n=1 Tax=uncultured Winogradskyella sp. TaxID=395353 RepID=UPI002628DAC0|nr:T9SS type A sorting domain-containing protein [uncultured Winogradskyella sp.]